MADEEANRLRLSPTVLLIAALPVLVFAATDWFLDSYGAPNPFVWQGMAEKFDGYAESANRISVLAGFILFVAGALASGGYFVWTLLRLPAEARQTLLAAFGAVIAVGVLLISAMNTRETQSYAGAGTVCVALSPPKPGNELRGQVSISEPESGLLTGIFDQWLERPPSQKNAVDPPQSGDCATARFKLLRNLLEVERILLVLSVAALALGSISCLTLPDRRGNKRFLRRVIQVQAARLNRYLYLSATLLVVGLFFVSAFLRWPGFIFHDQTSFNAHVNALLLYFGISYSILLASYYAPVALLLSRAARRAGESASASAMGQGAFAEPLKAAKVAAAIFAPALASVAAGLMDMGT